MKNAIAGLEAINFDSKSKLAEHLEELFQDCIDYVKSQGWDNDQSGSTFLMLYRNLAKMWSIDGEYGKRLTQIAIDDIGFSGISYINVDAGYSIIPFSPADVNEKIALLDVYMRTGDLEYLINDKRLKFNKSVTDYIAALKYIGSSFDPNTGKFNISTIKYGYDRFAKISPIIGLPIGHAFLNSSQSITARELTAVYLHEFGHMINILIGYAQNGLISNLVYNMGKDLESSKLSQMKLPTEVELNELLAIADNIGAKAIEYASARKDSMIVAFCSKILTFVKSLLNTSKKIDNFTKHIGNKSISGEPFINPGSYIPTTPSSSNYVPSGYTPSNYFPYGNAPSTTSSANGILVLINSAIIELVAYGIVMTLIMVFLSKTGVNHTLRKNSYYNYGVINGTKISEVTGSFNTYAIDEQRADTLCVRFGYGHDLIAFLSRLDSTHYQTPLSDTSCTLLRLGSDFLANLCGILPGLLAFGTPSLDIHREGIKRIQSVINESNRYFKLYWDRRNSPFGRKLNDDIQNLRKRLEEAKHAPANSLIYKLLHTFFNRVIDIDYLADTIITGHLGEDYTKMAEQLDDIFGNNLYYWAQLFEKTQTVGENVDASNFVAKRS